MDPPQLDTESRKRILVEMEKAGDARIERERERERRRGFSSALRTRRTRTRKPRRRRRLGGATSCDVVERTRWYRSSKKSRRSTFGDHEQEEGG